VLIAGLDATRAVEPGYLDVARISRAHPASVVLPAVLPALVGRGVHRLQRRSGRHDRGPGLPAAVPVDPMTAGQGAGDRRHLAFPPFFTGRATFFTG